MAGNNGLRSIKAHLHDAGFVRIRIGIGKPPDARRGADHVLKRPSKRERTELDVSSIVDTWIVLRDLELGGERNRAIHVLKSRGMPHSNQLRKFTITSHGIDLLDAQNDHHSITLREPVEAMGVSARFARKQVSG